MNKTKGCLIANFATVPAVPNAGQRKHYISLIAGPVGLRVP
uniref:Uncharacterized protein n=3 Tax=Enterobacteriaceae TaxID=543 RepID=A0A3G1QBI6_ECOLX|nr:hypothetical protein [Salmonella enterica subsp. enterica serovar Indiana]AWH57392.1 hypothetical protein [Escherichia coli]QCS40182.1 Hypothetical protein [Salmonella enterica subsp. enterica serovar California]